MKKIIAMLMISLFLFTGCYTINHKVGQGAQGTTTVEARQWYVLWGLVPINDVNSQQMAGGSADYTVTTKMTFVDIVIGAFTGLVTVQPMTVKVQK